MTTLKTLLKQTHEELTNIQLDKYTETIIEQGVVAINIKTYSIKNTKPRDNETKLTGFSSILNIFTPKSPVQKETIEDTLPVGSSKIGGHPDVPADFSWPYNKEQPLSLLAQFNLADIKAFDLNDLLPETGILHFFYDSDEMPWGDRKEDKAGWKIIYTQNTNNLKRMNHPNFKENDFYFNPCKLSFKNFLSLPGTEKLEYIHKIKFTEEEEEQYLEYTFDPLKQNEYHYLLGYPMAIQNEEMELDCEQNTRTIKASNKKEYKEQLEKNLQDWILLFQLDSETKANMMWGDCGRLYFWIRKDDLKNKNFDDVWMILQCY